MSLLNTATTARATVDGLNEVYRKFVELKNSLPEPEFELIYSTQEAVDFLLSKVDRESEHYGKPITKICGIPFTVCSIPELDGGREALQQRKKVLVMRLEAGSLKAWVINGAAMAAQFSGFTAYVPAFRDRA